LPLSEIKRERTTTEIVIDNMIVLDSRRRPEEAGRTASAPVSRPAPAPAQVVKPAAPAKESPIKKTETEEVDKSSSAKTAEVKEEVKADDIPF